ncbi:MAG TPA: hypothetical protein VGB87_21660, partial [Vicinamibacteria bacterium]
MDRFRAAVEGAKQLFAATDDRHPEGRSYALEARHYHEDFDRAFAAAVGPADGREVAHAVSTKGYLKALADRVREYDETGRLPAFFLFQTQFFYEGSKSRLYLSLLEDPLHHRLELG